LECAVFRRYLRVPPTDPAKQKVDPGLVAALSVGAAGVGGMIGWHYQRVFKFENVHASGGAGDSPDYFRTFDAYGLALSYVNGTWVRSSMPRSGQ